MKATSGATDAVLSNTPPTMSSLAPDLAAEAFLYGYPLVYCVEEMRAFVAGGGQFPVAAPLNEFGHVRHLAGPELRFVSPNNDTCYSLAVVDVRSGPPRAARPGHRGHTRRRSTAACGDSWRSTPSRCTSPRGASSA